MSSPAGSKPYAVRVQSSWDKRDPGGPLPYGITPFLSVEQGQLGWAFQVTQDKSFAYLHVFTDDVKRGWVPTRVLVKGSVKKDTLPIELPPSRGFPRNIGSAGQSNDNCLRRTLRLLWERVAASRAVIEQKLPNMSERAKVLMFHPRAAEYGEIVYRCIIPQALEIMRSGSFTPEAFQALPSVTHGYPGDNEGLYTIQYRQFGRRSFGTRSYEDAMYWGQTNDFARRDGEHLANSHNSRSNHYRIAAIAQWRRMIPVVFVRGQVPEGFLDIAEFSFVVMMNAWTPILFNPDDTNLLGAYSVDFEAACLFKSLMDGVRQATGWNPVQWLGLNWDTPIVRGCSANQTWTSWYSYRTRMTLYRTRRPVAVRPDGYVHLLWSNHQWINIPDAVQQQAGFTNGQAVHVVAELSIDENGTIRPHPFRWVRFPHIGRNPELEKLECIALRIEWLDPATGRWKSVYLERTQLWEEVRNRDVLAIYRAGLMIWMDLREIEYTGKPAWVEPRPRSVVQRLDYDHLQQKLTGRVIPVTTLPWPADNSIDGNEARLRALFPTGVVFRNRPDPMIAKRVKCDLCLSQRSTTACKYDRQRGTCKSCEALRRPCTFTNEPANELLVDMKLGGRCEELAVAVNVTAIAGAQVRFLENAPFDPRLEDEEHAQLALTG